MLWNRVLHLFLARTFLKSKIFGGFDGAQCSLNIHPPYRVNAGING
jgi:hypothetical protein